MRGKVPGRAPRASRRTSRASRAECSGLTLARVREILGTECPVDDADVEALRAEMVMLAELALDLWEATPAHPATPPKPGLDG